MAQITVQNAQLSRYFITRHVVVDPTLTFHLFNQVMNDTEKLVSLQNFVNEIYPDQLYQNQPFATRRWRVAVMPIGHVIPLILSDPTTIGRRLRAGMQSQGGLTLLNNMPIVQAHGQVGMIKIRIAGHTVGPGEHRTAVIKWAHPEVGSRVSFENFGAYLDINGDFYYLLEPHHVMDNPPPCF